MSATDDEARLDTTLKALYAAISFPEGGEPDWQGIHSVFHPAARLTRITPEAIDYFTVDSFQAMAREMLDRGVYTSFFEVELTRSAQIFGSMAHVLSAYETKRDQDAASYLSRGLNSIQLIRVGAAWKVHSLLWDEETDGRLLELPKHFRIKGC